MRWWLWALAAVTLVAAAGGVYFAAQSPAFVAGLSALAAGAAWKAIRPVVTKPLSEADTRAKNTAERRGDGDNWIRRRLGSLRDR